MSLIRRLFVFGMLAGTSFGVFAADLSVVPRVQETYVWCWVAVGQMVFEYYDIPNVNPAGDYQCGIVGLLAAGTVRNDCASRCQNCTVPAGSASGVIHMIEEYPRRVAVVTREAVPRLRADYRASALSSETIERVLDEDAPVIAGISPSGRPPAWASSQHVALIVGYRGSGSDLELLVNDPYPFAQDNPYERAGAENNGDGSYWIGYGALRRNLNWRESIVVRKSGTTTATPATPMGDFCCFMGPLGPGSCQLNLSGSLPLGSTCTCTYPAARFVGRVCNP
jgi:hypothetical protein